MSEKPDPIRGRFIHQVGELAASMGLSRSVGQIYALLYMSAEPVSLSEIAESCRMRKGNASTYARELERWDAVRRVGVPGDRADYYEANRDVAQIVIGRLEQGLGRRLDTLDRMVQEARTDIEETDPDNDDFYRERLEQIERLSVSLRKVLNNVETFHRLLKRFM